MRFEFSNDTKGVVVLGDEALRPDGAHRELDSDEEGEKDHAQ